MTTMKKEVEPSEFSLLLKRCAQGDQSAENPLYELAYAELKRLARASAGRERPGATLKPTALVGEVFMRMPRSGEIDWTGRQHFFAIAARAMRRALVDRARERLAFKRPNDKDRLPADERLASVDIIDLDTLLDVHNALSAFEAIDPKRARVIEMHYFAGMTYAEIALVVGKTEDAIKKDWRVARLWLCRWLQQ